MSKAFHPDRFYQKNLGSFRPWLTEIFETMSRAFAVLSDERQKSAYLASLRGEAPQPRKSRAQTPQEHAAELFERACSSRSAATCSRR